MIVLSGSRKMLQEEQINLTNFQPNERTELENELGDWISCNTIPVDHPRGLCFYMGDSDVDFMNQEPLYDNSLGQYKKNSLHLGGGYCMSFESYKREFKEHFNRVRESDRDYLNDTIIHPSSRGIMKCGAGVSTVGHLKIIIPHQYRRIQRLHRVAESLLDTFRHYRIDGNLLRRLLNLIGRSIDITQLEDYSLYLRNILIDAKYIRRSRKILRRGELWVTDPPLGFDDPAPHPSRYPERSVPTMPAERFVFIFNLVENISARLGIMEDTLRDFMWNMRNTDKNKTFYFSRGYLGLSSIGKILIETEHLLTQIQVSFDDFLEQYPPDEESDSDTGSIDLGSEDTDDTDDDDYI